MSRLKYAIILAAAFIISRPVVSADPVSGLGGSSESVGEAPTIIVENEVPALSVIVSPGRRLGKNVFVDVVFINTGSKAKKCAFVDKEPCAGYDDYVTTAWDFNGNAYEMKGDGIVVMKGDERMSGAAVLPSGVPVKLSLMIRDVPRNVNMFAMLSMAFRDLMPGESYGQALMRVRNLPVE